ncbi:transmembrane amino acid transporter protein, partial [Gigaspora rosea]
GVGALSLPLALNYSGWIIGALLFFFGLIVTNYAAIILIKCLSYKEGVYTYPDIAEIAFGKMGKYIILVFFTLETITSSISLVILIGDSLQVLFPNTSIIFLKIISWAILVPSTLIDMKYLSYSSILGVLTAVFLTVVILINGFINNEQPGSLLNPMKTELWPTNWNYLPLSFGLLITGYAGHATFPSIYLNMKSPDKYPTVVNISFAISTVIYILLGVCGYIMFGNQTKPEITQNIKSSSYVLKILNQFVIWLVAVSPFTKFALFINPVNMFLELEYRSGPCKGVSTYDYCFFFIRFLSRTLISTLIVFIAIVYPNFDKAMELIGSLLFYTISAIFPCMFYLKMFSNSLKWWEWLLNIFFILVCTILSILGTIWSFLY